MGSRLVTFQYLTMNILLIAVLSFVTLSSCASVYKPLVLYPYYVPYQQLGPTIPIATPRQGFLGNLINSVGNILTNGNQVRQDDDGDGNVVTPEDAQAVWISGFPIRRRVTF